MAEHELLSDVHWYVLDGPDRCKPVRVNSLSEWADWMESNLNDCLVAHDKLDKVRISTRFIGLDLSGSDDKPEVFETAIFGGEFDSYKTRCSTWDDALDCHAAALKLVRSEDA